MFQIYTSFDEPDMKSGTSLTSLTSEASSGYGLYMLPLLGASSSLSASDVSLGINHEQSFSEHRTLTQGGRPGGFRIPQGVVLAINLPPVHGTPYLPTMYFYTLRK